MLSTRKFLYFIYKLNLLCLFLQLLHDHVVVDVNGDDEFASVKFLPGFQGPLPFQMETGYVGVGESEDVQLFYYFVKSEKDPANDPLILWLTGGPGCTSFTGFMYEIGPLYIKEVEYNGTLPTLELNHNAWTKIANIIFLDQPVGTGFSYARTSFASHCTDLQACAQAVEFLRKWLILHPEFHSNPFYVGGDSYSGITVPIVSQLLSNENEAGVGQFINLKGYLLGNPKTFPAEGNYQIPFFHGMGIISDELYESLRRSCGDNYQNLGSDNEECSRDKVALQKCTSLLFGNQILEPICVNNSISAERRALKERFTKLYNPKLSASAFKCRDAAYILSSYWIQDENVQKALHIRKGTKETWIRCDYYGISYERTTMDSRKYHANLSRKGYRSLIYSGDHDSVVPFQSTQAWIRDLNYSIIDDWRPWIVEGQYAGYTRTYSNRMTYATVKGGGHTAPEYKPAECYIMFQRWISNESL